MLSAAVAPAARAADRVALIDPQQDEAAVAKLRPLAEAGNPDAQLSLGIAYDLGRGAPADAALACTWYGRAGDAGLGAAEFDRAVMQDAARCGARDAAQTALWYARAAARGHARAQYDLALLYAAGDGVPRNLPLARAWAAAAAANAISAPLPASPAAAAAPAELRAATALWPKGDLIAAADGGGTPLVWTSAEQPEGTAFSVELYATGVTGPALVETDETARSAVLTRLAPGAYVWRVLTANPLTRHYVTGDWTAFRILPRP